MHKVWLKIRNRNNLNFVLRNLNGYLGSFSDKEKYDITIYSEDLNLPSYYKNYNILTKKDLLTDKECKELYDSIYSKNSPISSPWKGAGFALCAPYFFLKNNDFVINIDACDTTCFGPFTNYIEKSTNLIDQLKLPTLSYDYILSHNPFYTNKFIPNHFTFGVNIGRNLDMKNLILKSIQDAKINLNNLIGIKKNTEVNIDILLSCILTSSNHRYIAFSTQEGFMHGDFDFFYCRGIRENNIIEISLNGRKTVHRKHNKTIIF